MGFIILEYFYVYFFSEIYNLSASVDVITSDLVICCVCQCFPMLAKGNLQRGIGFFSFFFWVFSKPMPNPKKEKTLFFLWVFLVFILC